MKFKIDENLPVEAAELLRDAGHDAHTVGEESLTGSADPAIADVARVEGRAIITADMGFADTTTYVPAAFPGIVVLRLGRQSLPSILRAIGAVIREVEQTPLAGRLWIVEDSRIRVR